jgi:crotonobetainyl-CoA:carnitine CoA-transferase CaiB-like acyl-CoA transferase
LILVLQEGRVEHSYRALDLTDEQGFFCGKVLADLGFDVIKVERPGGDPSRRVGPFYKGNVSPETSLFWFAYNANKRGITLNLESRDGQEIFRKLVLGADVVINSSLGGCLESLGIGYEAMSSANPALVWAEITPFGPTGPYSGFKSCEIVNMALSGLMYLIGDPDRPPVPISFPHVCLQAAAQTATAILAACYWREQSGLGQRVDVAIRESVLQVIAHLIPYWVFNGTVVRRAGQLRDGRAQCLMRLIWPCKDGFVIFFIGGGVLRSKPNLALVEWMGHEGVAVDPFRHIDWDAFDMEKATPDFLESLQETIGGFFLRRTKADLFEEGVKRRIDIYPVADFRDVTRQVQLRERSFWTDVPHPELGVHITYPGPFVKLSETPIKMRRRAPLIGEHNREIYLGELGFSEEQLYALTEGGVI